MYKNIDPKVFINVYISISIIVDEKDKSSSLIR